MKNILAIDPGAGGGMAWPTKHGVECRPMPATDGDVRLLIDMALMDMLTGSELAQVVMEEVGGYCGGDGDPGSRMFNFGRGYGFILGILAEKGIRINLVRPQKWQKALSLGSAKDCVNKRAWKNKLKQRAQQLFPHNNVTLKTSDAILLLEYGQQHIQ